MPRLKNSSAISIGLCSSGLFILAAPGWDLSILAWGSLVPLFLALRGRSVLSSFFLAWTAGCLAYAGIVHWVTISAAVTTIEFVLIAAYLGLHWGLFGAAVTWCAARSPLPLVVTAPILWVTFEYLRCNFFPLELPWTLLAHGQYQNVAVIQIAAVTGLYGISAMIVVVNSLIAESIAGERRPGLCAVAIVAVVGLAVVFGRIVLAVSSPTQTVSVTVVPGNIAQDARWEPERQEANFRLYLAATAQAHNQSKAALVVWPETSIPGSLNRDLRLLTTLQNLAREVEAALLIGTGEREKFAQGGKQKANRYNSAMLFLPGEPKPHSYHKIQLLPFGEYLPWANSLPWPARYRTHSGQYAPGQDHTIFTLSEGHDSIPFSVMICWEGIFPNLVRQFVRQGATFLVGISNEAWFDGASARQFLAMNTFRAVENRRALVRSVNGGWSGFIDPYGRLVAAMTATDRGSASPGFLTYSVEVVKTQTFYTIYGDVFAQAMTVVAGVLLLVPIRRWRPAARTNIPGLVYAEQVASKSSVAEFGQWLRRARP